MLMFRNLGFQKSVKSQPKFIYCTLLHIRVTKHCYNILQNFRNFWIGRIKIVYFLVCLTELTQIQF